MRWKRHRAFWCLFSENIKNTAREYLLPFPPASCREYGIDDRLVQDGGKTDLEKLKRDEVLLVRGGEGSK